jgi:hypothetical protein
MTVSRRTTLEWMASISVIAGLPRTLWAADRVGVPALTPADIPAGYGIDPNLKEPVVPWPLVMEPQALKQVAVLADLILPGSDTALTPSTLGVADFINEWVSAPYPEQLQDRTTLVNGLRWVDTESILRGQRAFLDSDEHTRKAIVEDLARADSRVASPLQHTFFRRLRYLVITAHYTTPEGFREIGYTGNEPLAAYPPMTDEERAILAGALAKLGLSP